MVESSFKPVPLPPLAKLPVVSSQEVAGFFDVSTRLEEEAQRKWRNDVEAEATRQGIVDGQQGKSNADLLYNPTYRGKAYTRANQLQFKQTIDLNAAFKIQSIIAANPLDSVKARREIEGYLNGVVQGMPPAIKERLGQNFLLESQVRANVGLSRIRAGEDKLLADGVEAKAITKDLDEAQQTVKNAEFVFSEEPEKALKSLAGIIKQLADLESRRQERIIDETDREIAAHDPVRLELAKRQVKIDTLNSGLKAHFRRSTNKEEFLRQFRDNEFDMVARDEQGRVVLDLTPTERQKQGLVSWMQSELSREGTRRNAEVRAFRSDVQTVIGDLTNGGVVSDEVIAALRTRAVHLQQMDIFEVLSDWHQHADLLHQWSVQAPGNLAFAVRAQRRMIETLRDERKDVPKREIVQLEQMEGLLENMKTALASDQMNWAARQNLITMLPMIVPPGEETIEIDGQTYTQQDLANIRIGQGEAVSERYGIPARYLTDTEIEPAARFLNDRNNSAIDKFAMLTQFLSYGDKVDEVMSEIAPRTPIYGLLGGLMVQGTSDETILDGLRGLEKIEGIGDIDGVSLINTNSGQVTDQTDLVLGRVFNESSLTGKLVVDLADALYTETMHKKGKTSTQVDAFDPDEWEIALQRASGAHLVKSKQGDVWFGGIGEFHGVKVVVPSDIPRDQFDELIQKFTDEDWNALAAGGGSPFVPRDNAESEPVSFVDEINALGSDVQLKAIGHGQYLVGREVEGNPKYYQAPVDPGSDIGARREGLYVLDLNLMTPQRRTELFKQINLGFFEPDEASAEGIEETKRTLKKFGEKLGKAADEISEEIDQAIGVVIDKGLAVAEEGLDVFGQKFKELQEQVTEAFNEAIRLGEEFLDKGLPKKVERLLRETEKQAKQLQRDRSAFFKLPLKKQTASAERKLSERTLELKKKAEETLDLVRKEAN